ncbi:MAG: hypothetical protein JO129_02100 [Candidatus Dependentiae bacterium]|nr:hypothetical protein [Candidatus Dependentiae bacterium]
MKQYITMKKFDDSIYYQILEPMNFKFVAITRLFDPFIRSEQLIDWFSDEKKTVEGNDWVEIRKERSAIALYDISDQLNEEYPSIMVELDPAKRFEMSRKNFAEIIYQWEELRVSRPDIILVVIHEDNHVSLETDPTIIKKYQDAGYAFDINKENVA